MARIILTLDLNDIGMLLQGAELSVTPSVSAFDNLQEITVRVEPYGMTEAKTEEYL